MNESGSYESATHDGMTVTTNTASAADLATLLQPAATEPDVPSVDAAPPTETDAERHADGTFKPKAKPRNDPRARVEAATAKEAEAKREREAAQKERDDARAEAARYRAELEQMRQPRPPQVPSQAAQAPASDEPNPADVAKYPGGEYDPKFLKDQARYEARQEFQTQQRQQAEALRQRQHDEFRQRAESEYAGRMAKAKADDPTFESRLRKDLPFNLELVPHFITLENAPEILIYLSEHPDDAQRLATLHPIAAIRELGMFSGRLAAAHARGPAPVVPVSKAAAPIQPLGSSAQASDATGSDDESFDAHYARFQKDVRAGRR